MPWKENLVMDQKKEFVLESLKENINFTNPHFSQIDY